jgi:hypothetical protein
MATKDWYAMEMPSVNTLSVQTWLLDSIFAWPPNQETNLGVCGSLDNADGNALCLDPKWNK